MSVKNTRCIKVIGAGLAGSEAAFQIAESGLKVHLYEMRPQKMTEAHTTGQCAELVCSNSFGSDAPHSASRILKDELTALNSFILKTARKHQVPAGSSLAMDRDAFSNEVTEALYNHPNIEIYSQELEEIPEEGMVVIATGPLTSAPLARNLKEYVGQDSLYFYDAISPIFSHDSLNLSKMFYGNRYDKGETRDFLNIPLDKETYDRFVEELLKADVVLPHEFEEAKYFEGCMPIEAIAARGHRTLAFGPMKPVGLEDPKTGKRAYAVIQLRTENIHKTAYNLVGFQTKLKYKEQERIFRMLPGLENAEFIRHGSMHRNTYLDSPRLLMRSLQLKKDSRIFIAGQLTGNEGYLESSATGLVAGLNASRIIQGLAPLEFPNTTMLGALLHTITDPTKKNFQPTNSNMGILPPLENPIKDKKERNAMMHARSETAMLKFLLSLKMESCTESRFEPQRERQAYQLNQDLSH